MSMWTSELAMSEFTSSQYIGNTGTPPCKQALRLVGTCNLTTLGCWGEVS